MVNFFEKIGQEFLDKTAAATELINFLGLFLVHLLATLKAPLKPFFSSLCSHLYTSGLLAIPIIIVTSFVVGVVLCYEGVVQLAKFGAESSVVTLISYSVLREAGALITAIVLAGRSGSSFTAEIGAMKINEEIDAMKVMGIDPINALIVPRIISLIFILPALTFIADIFGLLGGALICHAEIHMSLGFYFEQIQNTVNPTTFLIGLVKAPFFGLTIGLIGCLQGFKVHGSASSVGRKTTLSVVQSIFCIILLNSLFSVTVSYFRIGS